MNRSYAVAVLSLCLFTATFAVNLQAPLYSVYVADTEMGTAAVTIAFSAYVAGLMPTLVMLGGLSDRIGRRSPIILALVFGGVGTFLLVLVPGWTSLILARFLLGVGTGLVTTSGTAYMTELMGENDLKRAAIIVTSSTTLGFGGGALATGISLSLQGETLLPISFLLFFVAVPILSIMAYMLPRCDAPNTLTLLRLPIFPSGTWQYGTAMGLAWSATGMTIAVVPLELQVHGLGNWTGLVIFLSIFVGFLCQPLARRLPNHVSLKIGLFLAPIGYFMLVIGGWANMVFFVLLGAAVTSASSYGFSYLAAMSEFSMKDPVNRARTTAGLFVYAYVGFSIPVIVSGVLADFFGILVSLVIFGSVLLMSTMMVALIWKCGGVDCREATASVDIN